MGGMRQYAELAKQQGVGSRHCLLQHLAKKTKDYHHNKQPLYLFIIKLENYTKINKNRGQLGTACVMRALIKRLNALLKYQGCIYQLNADQFALVLSGKHYDVSSKIIDGVLAKLRQPVTFHYDIVTVELAMGYVEMFAEVSDAQELLRRAETAIKLATAEQANWRYLNCQRCKEKNKSEKELFKDLKQGLANAELHLAGQPIYDFDTGKLTIIEVLLRWQHKNYGAINPLKIIELASKNGYLYHVAVYVSQQLADFLDENKTKYQAVSFAINFNMPQIINKKLIEHIFDIFDHHGIDRSQLIFESTETDALPVSFEDAAGHFNWIRQQGVQIAMDDFGSGYSTLALLSSIDVDLVKIDRSLVTDIENNPRRLETLLSILNLCQRLELKIVVEGIENQQQNALLLESNLSNLLVQGYFYAKPATLTQHEFCQTNTFIYKQQQCAQLIFQEM